MGRAARARQARHDGSVATVAVQVRCYNDVTLIGCQGAAVHQRGSIPLCQFCEDSASSLTRLPVRPVLELDALGDLRRLQARRQKLDENLEVLVRAAQAAGHSYADIGLVLGVSRQAVQQRWGR